MKTSLAFGIGAAAIAAGSLAAAAGAQPIGERPIATLAPYPAGMADDVHRPGFNGRLWVGRPIIGGMQGPYPLGWPSPGPEAYGAFDNPFDVVPARVGLLVVPVSPWVQFHQGGLRDFEDARNFWLREQGYTGGVRTFVNDLNLWMPGADPADSTKVGSADIKPRFVIPTPAGATHAKPRLRVQAPTILDGATRVSLPPQASPVLRAAVANRPTATASR